ncbi:fungal-specific transcription factor domain-containing protein [Scheffersomyces amazonensis]|uniref:fungal-specific transcription factor domain-containing protein n=1 Tax=Scheffersomyces amazonensis TaxID=1078765 RepID=UPI00315DA34A
MEEVPVKKRKRTYGTFVCDYPECNRSFSRPDHLSRHKRNHDPFTKLHCSWPHCHQTFSRNDIREKHYQRHLAKAELQQDQHPQTSIDQIGNDQVSTHDSSPNASSPLATANQNEPRVLSPYDLIEWLYQDDSFSKNNSNSEFYHFPNDISPSSFLENVFAISPDFPHSNNRKSVDEGIRQSLIKLIPSLNSNLDFGIAQIERCLELYWLLYHPQYPILHKPSFSNYEAHPLLLLSMIILGASLSSCSGTSETLFNNAQKLAEEIAEPLRWLIFSHSDCKPPAKVYIIQSLLLLESFEINNTSRSLHERAFLYHGTKIQILRRSPLLGGDPLRKDVEKPPHVWKQWIEYESMKRACLMAFYLETVNATVYGHTLILYAYQIKLSLPCEDSIWEFDNSQQKLDAANYNSLQSPKFLDALRRVLNRENVQTTRFGRSVLLAGLLTILFQMQQRDLQLSFLEWDSMKESWNETISLAIDVWKVQICSHGCCDTESAVNLIEIDHQKLPSMLRSTDTRCKFSLYHIAQIYMRITHYDYIVYAGAPSRMNVKVTDREYENVEIRVHDWSHSLNGAISVIHAYLILCEMLLSPSTEDITYIYDPNSDPFLHRKNIIISAVLVIFAYNFSREGPESNIFDQCGDYYPDIEDGYSYLRRIRKELSKSNAGSFNGMEEISIKPSEYHAKIRAHANTLSSIKNKNHIVGLLKLFYKSFKTSKWELGIEYSYLLKNCIERSLGRKSVTCEKMYLSQF